MNLISFRNFIKIIIVCECKDNVTLKKTCFTALTMLHGTCPYMALVPRILKKLFVILAGNHIHVTACNTLLKMYNSDYGIV